MIRKHLKYSLVIALLIGFGFSAAIGVESGTITCEGSWPGWGCTEGDECNDGYADEPCELECLDGHPPRGTIVCKKPGETR